MPKCRSGRHYWSRSNDAEKCCNPKWRRVLLVGRDVGRKDVVGRSAAKKDAAVYAHAWEAVR